MQQILNDVDVRLGELNKEIAKLERAKSKLLNGDKASTRKPGKTSPQTDALKLIRKNPGVSVRELGISPRTIGRLREEGLIEKKGGGWRVVRRRKVGV